MQCKVIAVLELSYYISYYDDYVKKHIKLKILNIYSFNASGIRGKLLEFNSQSMLPAQNYDIISISESWLNEGISMRSFF